MSFFKKAGVRIVESHIAFKGWNTFHDQLVDYTKSSGETVRLRREVIDHGAAAAMLLYDRDRKSVVLVRQYRFGAAFTGHDGYLLEIVAGLTDGEDPQVAACREALEESGHTPHEVESVNSVFSSPGTVSEEVHLFAGRIDAAAPLENGGGLDEEHEDIEVVEVPFDDALQMVETGEITDAKTVLMLYWAALNRKRLFGE